MGHDSLHDPPKDLIAIVMARGPRKLLIQHACWALSMSSSLVQH